MTRFTRTVAALALVGLVSCSTPVNPTLVSDGQLLVSALQTIDAVAAYVPGVPAAAVALGADILSVVQGGLSDLQASKTTAQAFVAVVQNETAKLTPIAQDLKANATITNGIALVQKLVPVIAADVTPAATLPTSADAPDPRGALQNWINAAKAP